MTAACPDSIQIVERSPDHADAARLLAAFYDEQVKRYGFADSIEMNSGEFVPPRGMFVVVYYDGQPVGCAGWRWHDRDSRTVEIKKAFIAPASRGLGIGRQLLDWLERDAVVAGAEQSILETGVRNVEALRLFVSQGYRSADRYVPGRDPAINRAFVRSLVSHDL